MTDYSTLRAQGEVYSTSGNVDMYFYTGIIPNHQTWVNGGDGVSEVNVKNDRQFTLESDISRYNGNYYIGVQFVSGKSLGAAEFTSVLLIGSIYE